MNLNEIYAAMGLALGVGLMIGLQREQSATGESGEEARLGLGGIRTYPLFALAGAMAGLLGAAYGPWLVLGVLSFVCLPVLFAYVDDLRQGRDRGLTTEAAFVVTFLIGVLAASPGAVADARDRTLLVASLGVAVTALLALKRPLHDLVQRVSSDDLYATIKFAVVAVVVLPVLPDETFGPLQVLNARRIGWMVMLIAGVGFVGYVAIRLLGPGKGLGVTGLLGGMVSSTAVTLAFSGRSKAEPSIARACALGVILANTIMPIRVVINVSVVNPAMARLVGVAMGAVALTGLASALVVLLSGGRGAAEGEEVRLENPFKLTSAVKFGALYATILLVCKAATTYLPTAGIYAAGLLAGTTDVDAISLSMASLVKEGSLAPRVGTTTILLAVASNSLVKLGLAVSLGGPGFRGRIAATFLAMIAAGGVAVGVIWAQGL